MWNNQLERLLNGEQDDIALIAEIGDQPAIIVQFVSPFTIEQLGNGVEIYQNLIVRLHILHQFYNANDGTMDQDLVVLDIAEDVYRAFDDWMPSTMVIGGVTYDIPVGVMNRQSETLDDDHDNVYHFIQDYMTNWVDSANNRPINGILSSKNATLQTVVIKGEGPVETTNIYYN